jgi:hypothetical protein
MRTKESLKVEIRELMLAMAHNGLNMRMMERSNMWLKANELLHARTEILKSIAHRQGLLIEVLSNEIEYEKMGRSA